MFPTEIWEKILQEITCPEDLGRLKLVSEDWNVMIEKIFQRQISWDNYCSQEITENCMFYLLNQIIEKPEKYSYDLVRSRDRMKYNKIWREVYCYWKSWPLFFNHRVFIDKLNINFSSILTYEEISHLDVYRDFLGIVTNGYSLLFYKLSDLENIYYRVYNNSFTVQFTFWKTEEANILALTRSINGVIQLWDVIMKTRGINVGRGDFISIYREKCYILHDFDVMRLIYTDGITVLIPEINNILSRYSNGDSNLLRKLRFYYTSYDCFTLIKSTRNHSNFYTMDENLIAAISDQKIRFQHVKWYDTEKWREYYLFDSLHGRVECLCYHCKLLIIGLDSGTIYIFRVKKQSDLKYFDFTRTSRRKIIVDTKPIIAIRVIDFEKRRTIVAATRKNVHFINFLSN